MLRLLLLSALLLAVVYLFRRLFRQLHAKHITPPEQASKQLNARMVKCAQCGVYVPEDAAVELSGKVYCSEAHRDEAGSSGQ
ncbi:MAG: PP0621 family protein [Gammaproteobacteria bacterium]